MSGESADNIVELDDLSKIDDIDAGISNSNLSMDMIEHVKTEEEENNDKKSLELIKLYIAKILNRPVKTIGDMYANILKVTPQCTLEDLPGGFGDGNYHSYILENDHPYYVILRGQKWEDWEYFKFKISTNGGSKHIVGVNKDALDSIINMLYKEFTKYGFFDDCTE